MLTCNEELTTAAESNLIDVSNQYDIYKETFKRYRQQVSLDSVIDLTKADDYMESLTEVKTTIVSKQIPSCQSSDHFKPFDQWKVYTLRHGVDGLIIVPGILRKEFRSKWFCYFCQELPDQKEHNLQANISLEDQSMWNKLRWITFGYHHNWNTKQYNLQQSTLYIPDLIQDLSKVVDAAFDFNFRPEAGIVNYYGHKSSLYFHTDHSELNQDAPLLSLSLGCPAIFLIGGLTKTENTPIVPILLRDSDLLVMSGQSRLALHAICKIISDDEISLKDNHNSLAQTTTINRINVNVRQLF